MLAKTAARSEAARAAALVLLVACLGVLTAQLDSSVVTLALRRIDAELKVGVGGMPAVIDAYNVANAAFLLNGGTLGDLYGRKRILLLGFALFILGSVASMPSGVGPAFAVGAAAELLGAAVAWGFAGRRIVAAEAR
jgi:DHA2 family methylenomycin A resistance protein-like MFS transporter